jgi:hypothetical protein
MSRRVLIVALVAARVVFDQTLLPAVGDHDDASALLTRAREKVLDSIRSLPKYTCLETIDRTYYVLPPEKHSPHMMTEDHPVSACSGNGARHLSLDANDRLRVEVAAVGESEIHSWPGASRFDTRSFDQMIPFGPLSTGSFGTTLFDVFANPGAQIKFTATKADGLRDVMEYSFRVPLKASHTVVKGGRGWQHTAFRGSFEIDVASAELARLVFETDPLPPDTGMCQAKVSTDYHLMLIGDGEFRIPRRSELETFDTDGGQTDSVLEFSACREYTTESSIRFGDQDTPEEVIKTTAQRVTALPPGVSLSLALVGAIDLGTAAAGDPVSARVVHSVRARGSKGVLVLTDAIARGRILEMRHELRTSEFLITIRFDTLETKGTVSPLSIRLARELKAEGRNPGGFVTRGTEFSLPAPASMEPGSLFVFSAKSGAHVIPAGFQSKWTTVAP